MMKSNPYLVRLSVCACLALSAIGCSSEERRYRLSGNVTFKGQPVAEGYVVMEPDGTKGGKGGPGRAKIVDGKYDTSAEDGVGILGGPHLITLTGFDRKTGGGNTGMEVTLPKSLFTNHVVKEDLPKQDTVKDFDVK